MFLALTSNVNFLKNILLEEFFSHLPQNMGNSPDKKFYQQDQAISPAEIMQNVTYVAEESEDNNRNNQADNFTKEVKNTFKKADSFAGKQRSYTAYSPHQSYVETVDTGMDNIFLLF